MKKLFVVEDHPRVRRQYVKQLEEEGFLVEEAEGAEEFLERLPQAQPDLVLMDLDLNQEGFKPEAMSGEEATRRIRADPRFQEIPVIAITGWGMDRETLMDEGFDDLQKKPLAINSLVTKIKRLLADGSDE